MKHAVSTLVALGAALALGAPARAGDQAAAPEAAPPQPSLSGRWKLNVQESEDARQKMRQSWQGREPGSGGEGGGGYGRGGGGGRRGGGGYGGRGGGGYGGRGGRRSGGADGSSSGSSGSPQGARALFFDAAQELTITQTPTEIAILDQDGLMRVLHPDGKSYETDAGEDESKTRWEADHLVVETKSKNGMKVTETYGLEPEKRRLTLVVAVEGGRWPSMSVRRVYEEPKAE